MKFSVYLTLFALCIAGGCNHSEKNQEDSSAPDTLSTGTLAIEPDTLVTKPLSENDEVAELQSYSGTLNYSGNEPFVKPTLFVSDSLAFVLSGDKQFMNKTADSLQGAYITVYGKEQITGTAKRFEVHFYKLRE